MTNSEIQELASNLNDRDIKKLLWSLQAQNKVYIPQYYNNDHAIDYGCKNLQEMSYRLDGIYEQIDIVVADNLMG